jgi:serine/threonine protein kinase
LSINIYDKNKRKQLKTDLLTLQDIDCPYIVRFYGAFFSEGMVKLAIEYMDLGSLDKIIDRIKNKPSPCTPEIILSKITKEVFILYFV